MRSAESVLVAPRLAKGLNFGHFSTLVLARLPRSTLCRPMATLLDDWVRFDPLARINTPDGERSRIAGSLCSCAEIVVTQPLTGCAVWGTLEVTDE